MGNLLYRNYRTTALDVVHTQHAELKGKTVLITGCTTGIGVEIARALAAAHATVFISGRNADKLHAVRDDLNAELNAGGKQHGTVHSLVCDLSSLASVRAAAAEFKRQSQSLHVLICNAGVMMTDCRLSADGADVQMATNHIGHFVLFTLLRDTMIASVPARVVVVSSSGWHQLGPPRIDYSRLPAVPEEKYDRTLAYQQSKLANVLFASGLSRRYSSQRLTAYSLHPGVIQTGLQDEVRSGPIGLVMWLTASLWKTVQQGAATPVYCAVAAGIEEHSGAYFDLCAATRARAEKLSADAADKLWDWTEQFMAQH